MNVRDLVRFAQDANTRATVTIQPGEKGRIHVLWAWKEDRGQVIITNDMMDEDRWPHFAIRSYLQMAAEKMARCGGTPNRKSPLFMPATEVLDYQRQKDLLDMKLASGVISLQCYVDALVVLLTRHHKDNALWYGANKDG
jgi:hypothetical protein